MAGTTWSAGGRPAATAPAGVARAEPSAAQWLLPAGTLVCALTVLRLLFLARSGLNLDFEEAQYWLWAQAPDWGYWTKPPMVAWLIAATTGVCGDTEPCVRLAAPLLHAGTALLVGALGHALGGAQLALWSAVAYATLPGVALSAMLITSDVPLLFCWALALLAFVRLQESQRWPWAALCGIAIGAGVLSKYSMLVFVPCAALALVFSGRRLRLRHVALAAALAVLVVAPNAAWNLAHDYGTARHSLSRLLPGNTVRLDRALLFVLAQLAVVGPILGPIMAAAVLRGPPPWRAPARAPAHVPAHAPADDRRALLVWFTLLPVALATGVALVVRANANWTAPAYVAGTVLAVRTLLDAGGQRWLQDSSVVNVLLGLAVYGGLIAIPAVDLPGRKPLEVRVRLAGWDVLGRRIAERAAGLGDARVLVDLRELLAVAAYYGGVPESRLVDWNPSAQPHNHFQLRTRITAGDPGPFLFVSYRPRPAGVTKRFERVELVETVVVPLAPGVERTHWLFALRGFRGYGAPRARPGK